MRQLRVCDKAVRCLVYASDGRELITGDESGYVRFHTLPTAQEAGFLDAYVASSIEAMAIQTGGKILAIGVATGEIALFDPHSKNIFAKANNHPGAFARWPGQVTARHLLVRGGINRYAGGTHPCSSRASTRPIAR